LRLLSACCCLRVLAAAPLAAQLQSVPVYAGIGVRPGWTFGAEYGSGLNAASGRASHLGARLSGGFGRVTLGLVGGRWDAGSSASAKVGATAAVLLRGGQRSALALGLLVGLGYVRSGADSNASSYLSAPLGVTLTINRLQPLGLPVVPWLVPRVEFERVSFSDVIADQQGIGGSAGVSVGLYPRLGVHAAVDWLRRFARSAPGITLGGGSRLTAGIGVHVLLRPGGATP
jgi:hypothetical protein